MQKLLLIDNYINKNPKLADLYLYKAQLEFSTKDFIGVEKTLLPQFENNLFSDNQWKEAAYLLGISFYHERKLQKAQEIFLQKYMDNPTAQALITNQRYEAKLYQKYKEFYGYVFYIGQK